MAKPKSTKSNSNKKGASEKKKTRAKKPTQQKRTVAKKKIVLDALRRSAGIVSPACEAAGIDRSTYYKWINEDEDFARAVADVKEFALDMAESALLKNIQNGNVTAQIFYLKTQAKQRGYVERTEHGFADLTKLSNDQLLRFINGESLESVLNAERHADAESSEAKK